MAKCPHCGEVVASGQETCFACGQKVRARVRRHDRPHNAGVFVIAGVLVIVALVGIILMVSSRSKQTGSEARRQEQARIKDSIRNAAQVKRDSARAAARSDVAAMLADEVDKLEQRFEIVRSEVVKDQPSPAQAKLISQIRTEVTRLRQLAVTIAERPRPAGDSLRTQLRDGERAVRTLISDLSRAPKK